MTKTEIIAMAKKAGLCTGDVNSLEDTAWHVAGEFLIDFFHLAFAAGQKFEREEAAIAAEDAPIKTARQEQREACAAAIRARGEK